MTLANRCWLLLLLAYVNQRDSIQFSLTFFGRRRRRLAEAELSIWLIDGSAESYEAWRRCMQLHPRRRSFVATYDLGNLLDVLRRRVGFLSPLQAAVVILFIVTVVVVVARHLFSTCCRRRCGCCRCCCSCCCGCCLCCCCWWGRCRLRCIICVWCHYKWY